MFVYSHLFATLHDERAKIGNRYWHYSVLRAVIWDEQPTPHYHDFAVIWDEDHDVRVIWLIEQLYLRRMLPHVAAIGEHKGCVFAHAVGSWPAAFESVLADIAGGVPGDYWSIDVEPLIASTDAYLIGVASLWALGAKLSLTIGPPLSFLQCLKK